MKYPTLVRIKIKPDAAITRHYGTPKPADPLPYSVFMASKKDGSYEFLFNGIPYSVDPQDVDLIPYSVDPQDVDLI